MKVLLGKLKKYSIAPFLFVIFSFLHGITYSFQWLRWSDMFTTLLPILGGTVMFFLLCFWFFKNAMKSSVFTSICVAVFFYFTYILNGFGLISKYFSHFRIAAPLIFCLILLIFYWINKTKNKNRILRINLFFNVLFVVYIFVDCCVLSYKIVFTEKKTFSLVEEKITTSENNLLNFDSLPDIYFLVFDAYASSSSLKEIYNYDNSAMDSFLIKNNFFISSHSKSNYSETPFSISSTLNMNYFKKINSAKYPDDYPYACESMNDNRLFKVLRKNGYAIYNYSIFDFKEIKSKNENFAGEAAIKIVLGNSMLNYLKFIFNNYSSKNVKSKFDKVIESVKNDSKLGSPKFVYLHLMLPHPPYYFKSDGSVRNVTEYSQTKDRLSIKSYLDQLTYTNSVIKDLLTKLCASNSKKIIILEGDHGRRNMTYEQVLNHEGDSSTNGFRNLNAYYFYDKNYSFLYDSISPVNSFRVVMKQYFDMQIPLLKDTIVF